MSTNHDWVKWDIKKPDHLVSFKYFERYCEIDWKDFPIMLLLHNESIMIIEEETLKKNVS